MESVPLNEINQKPAVEFCCARCSKTVVICRSCWRNQKYCSAECSNEAYLARHRKDQKNYNSTEAGKESHKRRQRNYRLRQKNQD